METTKEMLAIVEDEDFCKFVAAYHNLVVGIKTGRRVRKKLYSSLDKNNRILIKTKNSVKVKEVKDHIKAIRSDLRKLSYGIKKGHRFLKLLEDILLRFSPEERAMFDISLALIKSRVK